MRKEAYYFPHDFEPTGDPKIQALIGNFGGLGYGVFWRIIEMLHSSSEQRLPLKNYLYEAIAKQMQANAKQIFELLKYAIEECELFASDGEFFWSERVNRNFERRLEISKIRSESGKKGAIAKQTKASAKQNQAKERKGKESILNNIVVDKIEKTTPKPPPEKKTPPTLQMVADQLNLMQPTPPTDQAQKFHDYYQSNGWRVGRNPMKDWKAALRNWIKRSKDFEPSKKINGHEPEQKYKTESDPFAVYKPY